MKSELLEILDDFNPISLKEMDRVVLQNRTDTKFVFQKDLLPVILNQIKPEYDILTIKDKRTNSYQTLYYDTDNLNSYIQHHNGKTNRIKIRIRNYIESQLNYLEIKLKNNKGRTIKTRKKITEIETLLSEDSKNFIDSNSPYQSSELIPSLWNYFTRITLVHKTQNERLTIDFNLKYSSFDKTNKKELGHIVIAEVKQEKASLNSAFIKAIKTHHIRKTGMSKYCIGIALINNNLKTNNFKEKILFINKLKYAS